MDAACLKCWTNKVPIDAKSGLCLWCLIDDLRHKLDVATKTLVGMVEDGEYTGACPENRPDDPSTWCHPCRAFAALEKIGHKVQ